MRRLRRVSWNDNTEAIEIIENALIFESGVINEALEKIKNAIEKQIPKRPFDIFTPVVTWGLCPTCKGELNKLGGRPNRVLKGNAFCSDCGQALDWGDEK